MIFWIWAALFLSQNTQSPQSPQEPTVVSPTSPKQSTPSKSDRIISGYLDIQLGKTYEQILDLFQKGPHQGLMIEPDRQFLRLPGSVTPKYKKRLSLLPASTVLPCAFRHVLVRFHHDSNTVERIECLLDNRYVSYLLTKQILKSSYGNPVIIDMSTSVWTDGRGNSLLLKRAGPSIIYQSPSKQLTNTDIPTTDHSLTEQILQTLRTL